MKTSGSRFTAAIQAKEAAFHDTWALETPVDAIRVYEAFESATALENRHILSLMGPLGGKRILDVGAGLGESSVYFALQGARVTCTDVSPAMVDGALALAEAHGVSIQGTTCAAEALDVPDNYFDFAYIANTIHHAADRDALFSEVRRALKPGGRFFSIDPLAYNPVINVYRRLATKVRTDDEAPLTTGDLARAKRYFADVRHREFWILSLALFMKYFLVDRVHPNADRYWKRILGERDQDLWWWKPLAALDRGLTRVPLLRWLAWNIVLTGEKPADLGVRPTTPG